MRTQTIIAAAALLAAVGAGSAGAQPASAPGASAAPDMWQFRCPAAGSAVDQSSGTTLRYRGDAANAPGRCLVAGGQRRFLGYWSVGEGFYRAGGDRIAAAVTNAVNLGTVPTVTFDYFGTNRTGDSIHIQETWRARPGGSLTTPAGTFDTVRVDRFFQVTGSAFQFTESVWFDRATNLPVTARVEHRNPVEAPSLVNWVAADVVRAQAAAR